MLRCAEFQLFFTSCDISHNMSTMNAPSQNSVFVYKSINPEQQLLNYEYHSYRTTTRTWC